MSWQTRYTSVKFGVLNTQYKSTLHIPEKKVMSLSTRSFSIDNRILIIVVIVYALYLFPTDDPKSPRQ